MPERPSSAPKAAPPATPPDLAEALAAEPQAKERFDAMSPSHQREYVTWIEEAKRPETRARRVAGMIANLLDGESVKGGKKQP